MDTINYCDFSIICRICLTKCGSTFTSDAIILNIFHKLTDLDFQTEDLPQQICLKCFDKINEIHRFSFQCKQSHSLLVECLDQQRIHEPKVEIVYVTCNDISDEYDNHIIEDEVENETTTNSEIFQSTDRLKTEEFKEEILDLEPDVLEVTTNNKIIDIESKISVENGDGPYEYGKCSNTFIKKSHLHKRMHSDEQSYSCDQCPKTFKLAIGLYKQKHSDKRPYKWDECPKDLKRHTQTLNGKHSDEHRYKCGKCSKIFKRKSNLTQHEHLHSAERSYKCDQCPKSFKQYASLYSHKQLHIAEHLYTCVQCTKTFPSSSRLASHERIHSAEQPYKCDQCPKTFNQPSNLYRHKRQHSDV